MKDGQIFFVLAAVSVMIMYISFNKGSLAMPVSCNVYPEEPTCKCFESLVKSEQDTIPVTYKCVQTECMKDSDCIRTGCSGNICSATTQVSTCTANPSCYQDAECGCVDGLCRWENKDIINLCLNK